MPERLTATVDVAGRAVTLAGDGIGRYADVPDPAALLAARAHAGLVYRAAGGLPLTATPTELAAWLGGLVDAGGFAWPPPFSPPPGQVTLVDLAVGTTGFVAMTLLLAAGDLAQLEVPPGLGGLLQAGSVGAGITYRGAPPAAPAVEPDDDVVTLVEQLG